MVTVLKSFFFLHFLVPVTAFIYLIPHIEVKIKTWGGGGYRKKKNDAVLTIMSEVLGFIVYFLYL